MTMHVHADNTRVAVLPDIMTVGCTFCAAVLPWLVFVGLLKENRLAGVIAFVVAVPGVLLYGVLASYWARDLARCDRTRPRAIAWASLVALWGAVAMFASWPCWILWWLL